jgi:hypothetical protein
VHASVNFINGDGLNGDGLGCVNDQGEPTAEGCESEIHFSHSIAQCALAADAARLDFDFADLPVSGEESR